MLKRIAFGLMLTLLLTSIWFGGFDIQPARASETIYIRADGSIDPPTAPIQRNGDVYTLTGNIISDSDGIVIERDDVVIDGAGYALTGVWGNGSNATRLVNRSNVTVRNMAMNNFSVGIRLCSTFNSVLSGNNMTSNMWGIDLYSSANNSISGNILTNNTYDGIHFYSCSGNNTISGNNVTANGWSGILLEFSSKNSIDANCIAANKAYGIELTGNSANNSVAGNTVTKNLAGGILLRYSDSNTVKANTVAYCGSESSDHRGRGVGLVGSNNNTLVSNNLEGNIGGIQFEDSSYNILRGNHLSDNKYNVGIYTSWPASTNYDEARALAHFSTHDIDVSNTVNEKPIHYLVDQSGLLIDSDNIGYLALVNCTDIHVRNASLASNGQGVLLAFTNSSTIENITISSNHVGIYIFVSHQNLITADNITNNHYGISLFCSSFNNINGNSLTYNGHNYEPLIHSCVIVGRLVLSDRSYAFGKTYLSQGNYICSNTMADSAVGVTISNPGTSSNIISGNMISANGAAINVEMGASNNTIYHNNFVDSNVHIDQSWGGLNVWDYDYPSGGNYWSDHNPPDADKDKIGDSSYTIDENNIDRYPLIYPFECYELGYVCSPDLNNDGIVNIVDVTRVALAFASIPGDPNWNATADMDLNEVINIVDVIKVAKDYGKSV